MALATATLGVVGLSPVHAQGKAQISGQVIHVETREPIADALILLRPILLPGADSARRVLMQRSDTTGTFLFKSLPAGAYFIEALYAEDASPLHRIHLTKDDRLEVEFAVGERITPVLPELAVTAAAPATVGVPLFLQPFYERVGGGNGWFLTRDDLQVLQGRSLWNALRTMPGLRISCRNGELSCQIHMGASNIRACAAGPEILVDGMLAEPGILGALSPDAVEGIEGHRMGSMPMEYRYRRLDCGAILVWTRRGPPAGG